MRPSIAFSGKWIIGICASKKEYELSFSYALAPYVTGSDAEDVLRAVDRKMYSKKHNLTPVF